MYSFEDSGSFVTIYVVDVNGSALAIAVNSGVPRQAGRRRRARRHRRLVAYRTVTPPRGREARSASRPTGSPPGSKVSSCMSCHEGRVGRPALTTQGGA